MTLVVLSRAFGTRHVSWMRRGADLSRPWHSVSIGRPISTHLIAESEGGGKWGGGRSTRPNVLLHQA